MRKTNKRATVEIYIDLLCWESLCVLVFNCRKNISKIFFFQKSIFIVPFIGFIEFVLGVPIIEETRFVSAPTTGYNLCTYEQIHMLLKSELIEVSESWMNMLKGSCKNLNSEKVRVYLQMLAFCYFYRPFEMMMIADYERNAGKYVLIIKDNPFLQRVKKALGVEVMGYSTLFSSIGGIKNREDFLYDKFISNTLYYPKVKTAIKIIRDWIKTSGAQLALNKFSDYKNFNEKEQKRVKIGVELLQSRVRFDKLNDLFWIKSQYIEPEKVVSIEDYNPDFDEDSNQILNSLNMHRLKKEYFNSLYSWRNFFSLKALSKKNFVDFVEIFRLLLKYFSKSDEYNWLELNVYNFKSRLRFWEKFYSKFGIRILFSMLDGGPEQQIKSQAIENIEGLYLGSHWSNYPVARIDNQKAYDILFTWSDYFHNLFKGNYQYLATFPVGYPIDCCFAGYQKKANALRRDYSDKFIISYLDNVTNRDRPNSLKSQLIIHKMLLNILRDHSNVILFLKPKRKTEFERIARRLPEIYDWIKEGRVKLFLSDNPRTKLVPAMVGIASDLVIGLGISTAATECCFAGTIAFQVDLTGFNGNLFSRYGKEKVVFYNIDSLRKAVLKQMTGDRIKYEECCSYYKLLDPFMDGKAYERVGFILNLLQKQLQSGVDRKIAVKNARSEYNILTSQLNTESNMHAN